MKTNANFALFHKLILLGRNKKKKHEKERLERQAECGVFHEP